MFATLAILAILTLPLLSSAAYWLIVLYRIERTLRTVPTARDGVVAWENASIDAAPLVSIVLPAHNEAEEIFGCVSTLLAQDYPALEVIAVLDRCTDSTEERLQPLAHDPRLRIIRNTTCPPDWAGKCHAAWRGAQSANGQWLLFTDADTRFAPSLLRGAMGLTTTNTLELLSFISTLSTTQWFERIVQPVATLLLMRLYPLDIVNRGDSKRNFANGQFMLFSREMYERIGGHGVVKNALLEDLALARVVRKAGGRSGAFFDAGMLSCSMYSSAAAFREGWKRIFIDACRRRPWRMRKNALRLLWVAIGDPLTRIAVVVLSILVLVQSESTLARIVAVAALAVAVISGLLKAAGLIRSFQTASAPIAGVVMYPWGAIEVARILFAGARVMTERQPVRWGGREYVLEPQGPWN